MTSTSSTTTGPREVFLHLLLIITLYLSVVSFIALVWQYINLLVPDVLALSYASAYQGIRWSSSTLLVSFPIFLWLSWQLERDFAKTPTKREARVRRWLLHLTLFLAALIIIGDLITLIYNFYGGELTTQFFLKILVVLAVAAGVFGYYLWDLRKGNQLGSVTRYAATGTSVLVGLALIAGFFIGGSPADLRQLRFDEQRLQDLQMIQSQTIYYWQRTGELPQALGQLADDITGFTVPSDPANRQPYEYRIQGPLSFELCADFAQENKDVTGVTRPAPVKEFGVTENWQHGQGRHCFERTIDPQLHGERSAVPSRPQ